MADKIKKLEIPVVINKMTCSDCGVAFGVPEYYETTRKSDHKTFYCPNGHGLTFTGKTDQDTIKDLNLQLDALKAILKCISDIEIGVVFNKNSLEMAVQLAKSGLK